MHVTVQNLWKRFGRFEASRDISFGIEQGRLIGLLGPSGGGKTTILRMLAGLEQPDEGDIWFHGRRVNELPPQKRGIGFVFQNYALFRHMSVFDNIAFGLQVQKRSKPDIQARVQELLELTGLAGLERRLPYQLSGGQRQRVAFARALAPEPQLLLLDEPFAAIDAKVRKELRSWLKEMIARLGITTIFVTHDQEEAIEVADEILIVNQGRLEQQGTPQQIYQEPTSAFVASFIGESNRMRDMSWLRGFGQPAAPAAQGGQPEEQSGQPGQPRQLEPPGQLGQPEQQGQGIIRPEFIEIGTEKEAVLKHASERGVVRQVFFRGSVWQVEVEIGDAVLFGYRSLEREALRPGDPVYVLIHRAYVFHGDKGTIVENSLKLDPNPVMI